MDVSSAAKHNLPSSILFHDIPPKKSPESAFCGGGYRALGLNLWPLTMQKRCGYTALIIFACLFLSKGTMTCLLHRRHFSSTPPGTRRASMLPHKQRKGFIPG
jgi:hypothetical protein